VVVFSFTHASAGDSRLWIDHVTQDAQGARIEVFQVIELESAPRLVRGMATAGIRSATPRPQWEHTILLYKQEADWKSRLGVSADKDAYIVLADGNGHVRWIGSGPFTNESYAPLKEAIRDFKN
jgi:hypothetical protein